jgi:hypothetical protein
VGIDMLEFAAGDFALYFDKDPSLLVPQISIRNVWDFDTEEIPEHNPPLPRIKFKYRRFFEIYHNQLGHYFRHLFHVLCFIDRNQTNELSVGGLNDDEIGEIKQKYTFYSNIVQSKLSSSEMYLLFYNGLCFPKMKALVEKYKILENLAVEDLGFHQSHASLYPAITLKKRSNIVH